MTKSKIVYFKVFHEISRAILSVLDSKGVLALIVKRIVPQLIKYGKVKRAGLGVVLVPDNYRKRIGISGAMVLEVQRRGAAEQAGIRETRRNRQGAIIYGDVIVKTPPSKNAKTKQKNDNNKQMEMFLFIAIHFIYMCNRL